MNDKLEMPLYRRIAGAGFVIMFFIFGAILVAAPDLVPDGVSGIDSADFGAFFVFAGVVCSPFILYPCLFDSFPQWVRTKLPQVEPIFRRMLCPPKR